MEDFYIEPESKPVWIRKHPEKRAQGYLDAQKKVPVHERDMKSRQVYRTDHVYCISKDVKFIGRSYRPPKKNKPIQEEVMNPSRMRDLHRIQRLGGNNV